MSTLLYSIMEERGISVKELERRSGVSEMSIRAYRTGRRIPKLTTAFYISDALGLSPKEVFGDVIIFNDRHISQMELVMRDRGVSVDELAAKTGLSRQTIMNYKNDPFIKLNDSTAGLIEAALKCKSEILWGEDLIIMQSND